MINVKIFTFGEELISESYTNETLALSRACALSQQDFISVRVETYKRHRIFMNGMEVTQ